jgi:Flp pilus assembly protein TadG
MAFPRFPVRLTRPLWQDTAGAAAILVGITFLVLIGSVGVAVDVSRAHAVRSKLQNSLDAALLAGVADAGTLNPNNEQPHQNDHGVYDETQKFFNANFPTTYMGSTLGTMSVNLVGDGVYEGAVTASVPTTIMNIFGTGTVNVAAFSQATRGFQETQQRGLELSLVLDNTGSMAGQKIADLKTAAKDLIDIIYDTSETLSNVTVSVVPYDVSVNIGAVHASWIQAASLAGFKGFASNRDNDAPTTHNPNELNDNPPLDQLTFFRTPHNLNSACNNDPLNTGLPPMQFEMSGKSAIKAALDTMIASGCTRINVGLMWGGFTLSPQWQGLFDPARSGLPLPYDANADKVIVLMTDGENTVYAGGGTRSNDDVTTAQLCEAIKSRGTGEAHVTIYTVAFGPHNQINEPLLLNCATKSSYYFYAPTGDDLKVAFHRIADIIVTNRTLRLSK